MSRCLDHCSLPELQVDYARDAKLIVVADPCPPVLLQLWDRRNDLQNHAYDEHADWDDAEIWLDDKQVLDSSRFQVWIVQKPVYRFSGLIFASGREAWFVTQDDRPFGFEEGTV